MDSPDYSIVLLPGLDGTGELFAPLVDSLPERVNPITVSYPRDSCKTYAELKGVVMPYLPMDQPFFILGESFSGPLSVIIADDRPEGLMGIMLCATFIKNPFISLQSWMKIFSIAPIYRLWPLLISLRARIGGENFRDIAELALGAIKSVNPDVISHRVKSILSVNVENEFKECPYPVLYLMAGGDNLIKRHNYKGIKALKKDVKLAVVDTLHFVLQLEPEKSGRVLTEFMDNVMHKAAALDGH